MKHIIKIAEQLGSCLQQQKLLLVTAESCTGGGVAQAITSIAGSSNWFERGFVTYSHLAKQEMLGVQSSTLAQFGAVSGQVAVEMASGALIHSHADVSLAVTGVAGPEGGSKEKPVGTVYFAWAGKVVGKQVQCQYFSGDRHAIQAQSVEFVLMQLLNALGIYTRATSKCTF